MDFRIFTEPQQGAMYADLLRVARTTEDAGFDAFFRSDHFLAMGDGSGEPGPTDAWLTLAALARETSRIRLGTLVTSATFRLPGPLAVAVAQVDEMSGGRVELGLGSGWFDAEHAAYGIPFPPLGERFERYTEQLEIITGLWATAPGETFDYSGDHYTITGSPALPRPVQAPGPPIVLGGMGPKRTPGLAARFAAEFNVPFAPIDRAVEQFECVDRACEDAGRDPGTIVRSTAQMLCLGRDEAELKSRAAAVGRGRRRRPELRPRRHSGRAGRRPGPVARRRPCRPGLPADPRPVRPGAHRGVRLRRAAAALGGGVSASRAARRRRRRR